MYESFDAPESHYLHRLLSAHSGRDFHPCFGAASEGGFYFRFPVRADERQRFPDLGDDVFFRLDDSGAVRAIDADEWHRAKNDA
jgi:hypothetical protein